MAAVFEFQHVSKEFGADWALRDLSLTGTPGRVLALLGENGAGKTTAIKILLGLIPATHGHCRVLGMDSEVLGIEIRRRVGYMPDRPALYEWMSVEEIGWFAAGFYPLGFLPRYRELIRGFRLPPERPIRSLSKGMQGKVSLALALAHEPPLLILDEPTSGLDPLVRREFLESMVEVAAHGRTVLLSSHQIAEVERVADEVAIIRQGRLVLHDSLETLKESVDEVVVTLNAMETAPPEIPAPARLMGARGDGRLWRLYVRDLDDAGRALLKSDPNHVDVQFRRPTLEELYFACMSDEFQGREKSDEPEHEYLGESRFL